MTTIAAPASPPPQQSPGGRTATRTALVIAAAALIAATAATLGFGAWGLSGFRVIADSQNLPAAMRALTIDTGGVPVAIRLTTERDATEARVKLRLVNSGRAGESRLTVSPDGEGTRVSIDGGEAPTMDWGRGGELTVALPPDQARRLSVRTQQDAGVLLADADVDRLTARISKGVAMLRGSARSMEVDVVHGEVTSREPISVTERFTANTADADIVVDFRSTAPATVDATSRDGDVVLGLPEPGPYLVHAGSGESTKVRVSETTSPASAVAQITARSDNGEVVVEDLRAEDG
ncbi:hypothetical protein M1247_07035 [Mycobacterium sp. 21AC1]|uniref:hypothetical protein n=1 Tax=[Mycobacterium] appelbergii TaxID=2939269 RepID=UPI00293930AD|nr:hypothetical protein [Mycobacterium sp. 21AC1]MDV3124662.1 hypothetical protein [Mycobacterium sp. 21AC1]